MLSNGVSVWSLMSRNCVLSSQAVLRRQEFLIKCVCGGFNIDQTDKRRTMQGLQSLSCGPTFEADSENILRAITPNLDHTKHKGQAGIWVDKGWLMKPFACSKKWVHHGLPHNRPRGPHHHRHQDLVLEILPGDDRRSFASPKVLCFDVCNVKCFYQMNSIHSEEISESPLPNGSMNPRKITIF